MLQSQSAFSDFHLLSASLFLWTSAGMSRSFSLRNVVMQHVLKHNGMIKQTLCGS